MKNSPLIKETIHGIEYDVYKDISEGEIHLTSKHTYLIDCKCLVVNTLNEIAHVMYSNSSVSGRMQGSNKYLVSAYGEKKKYICAHIFIETETSGVPIYKPEMLVSVYQTAKYDTKKPKKQ